MTPEVDPPLDWSALRACTVLVPGHVIRRDLPAETVLLNMETGVYYGLDEIGSRFFTTLSEQPDVDAAVQALSDEFNAPPEQIRRDAVAYCSELLALGLIELERRNG